MSKFFLDFCHDCGNRSPRREYTGDGVPIGRKPILCESCIESRISEAHTGLEPREIGILPTEKNTDWIDLKELVFVTPVEKTHIEIKYHAPPAPGHTSSVGGEVRARIATNAEWWPIGRIEPRTFGRSTRRARELALMTLRKWLVTTTHMQVAYKEDTD